MSSAVIAASTRRSLHARIVAAINAVSGWLLAPPRCDCGAELHVHDVWYPFGSEAPMYLWHCPACAPLAPRDHA